MGSNGTEFNLSLFKKMRQTEELLEASDGRELERELISLFETTYRLEYELELAVRLRDE